MTHRVLFAFVAALACAGPAGAEVHRASASLGEYAQIIAPGASRAQIHVPLIAAFSETGELSKLLSGNVEATPSGDGVVDVLDAPGTELSVDVGVSSDRFAAVLSEALKLAGTAKEEGRKTVLLVRLAPATESGPQVKTVRDDDWESAVLRWHEKATDSDLVILTLTTS